jgi:hypothetical protein
LVRCRRAAALLELRAQLAHGFGPLRGLEKAASLIEPLQRRVFACIARQQIQVFDHPRVPRGALPAVESRRDVRRGIRSVLNGLDLEQEVGPRQLAVEIARESRRTRVERRLHAIALGVADPPEPLVLERREQHDEPEQRGGDHEHRESESTTHGPSLARGLRHLRRRPSRFYVLNNLFAQP